MSRRLTGRQRAIVSRSALVVSAICTALVLSRRSAALGPTALLLVGSFAGLVTGMVIEHQQRSVSRRLVLTLSSALLFAAVVAPPAQSHDVWSYAMYGRIVSVHHTSPYVHSPAAFPHDPFERRVDPVWRHTKSVYGPLFTAVSAGGMAVAGRSPLAARLFFQVLAALALVMGLFIVDKRTNGEPMALAAIGLNPVLISVVNDGHNDMLVGLGILAAVVLARKRPMLAGGLLALAALVKIAAVLPLAAVALWMWRQRGAKAATALALVGIGAVGLGYVLAGGAAALKPLEEARLHIGSASVWALPRTLLVHAERGAGERGALAGIEVARTLASWATLVVAGLAAFLVSRRMREPTPAAATGAAVLAYLLLGAYVLPWYLAWGMLSLALCWRARLTYLAMAHGFLLELAYMPDTRPQGHFGHLPITNGWQQAQLDLKGFGLPALEVVTVIALVAYTLRSRRPEPPVGLTG